MIKKILTPLYHNFICQSFQSQHIRLLKREVIGCCETLLDIGCGDGSHLESLAPYLRRSTGVDIFEPAIRKARERNIYTETILLDVREISKRFKVNSFDCVVAFDLIEHMEKTEGLVLIEEMEKIAKKKVIIFTPNGFLYQRSLYGNIHQIHRSGWSVSEMKNRGYKVIGVHGLKYLLGEGSTPRWKPYWLWKTAAALTQPLCLKTPSLAFQLFCVKEKI